MQRLPFKQILFTTYTEKVVNISLASLYPCLTHMNRWKILIRKSGLVERYSMWHYTVPLYQTTGSEFATDINIYDIFPDETKRTQFGLANLHWSMVTIWEELPPPPLLLPWRWQAIFSCAILGLHSVTIHNTKLQTQSCISSIVAHSSNWRYHRVSLIKFRHIISYMLWEDTWKRSLTFFLLYFSQQTMLHSFVICHHFVSSNSQKQNSATKWSLVLALYRYLSSLPLHRCLPHVFFETAGTKILLSFTTLLPWTQKALSKISLHTLIWYGMPSLSSVTRRQKEPSYSYTHTRRAMTTEHCFVKSPLTCIHTSIM